MAEERHKHALPNGYLFEGYRIEGILGAGSFGVTYKAREVAIDRLVAIKEYMPSGIATRDSHDSSVHPISSADAEEFEWGLDRFQKEAAVLVSFRHPNIVPVFRFFAGNGTAYMVMEFQQGQSLSQLLISGRKLAEREIYEIIDPLLDGLERVHANGFLHRDIKPGNIYLRDDGSPVLIDFGAARQAMGERSRSLTRIFTPGYAPLEQYETRGNQGPWTDIYALGAVMYLMVTDQAPVDAPTRLSARARGNTDPLAPAVDVARKGFSRQLLETIDKCLEVMEDDRPQTVAELRGYLLGRAGEEVPSGRVAGTIMAGRAKSRPRAGTIAPAREPSLKRKRPQRAARNPLRLAAYAFAGVLLLSGAGVAGYVATDGFGLAGDEGNARRIAGNEEAKRKAAEEEARRKAAEEEARRQAELEEAKRKATEEEAKRQAEEDAKRQAEAAKRKAEEAARRRAEAEEAKRTAAEAAKRKAAEEAAKRGAAEEAAKRKAAEEEEIRRRVEAEIKRREEAKRRAEEAKRRATETEEAKRRAAEEAAKRKAADEEEVRRRVEAEMKRREEAARRAEEAKRRAEEAKRQADLARARREAQEAARRKAAEEAARRRGGQYGGQGGRNPEEANATTATRMLALFNGRSVAFTRMQANWTNYVVFFQAGGVLTGNAFMRATGVMQDATQSRDSGRWFVRGDRLCMQWKEWDNGRTSCYQINGSGNSYSASGGGLLAGGFQFR